MDLYIQIGIVDTDETFYIRPGQIVNIPDAINQTLKDVFIQTFDDNFFTPETDIQTSDFNYVRYYDVQKFNYQIKLSSFGPFTPSYPGSFPIDGVPPATPFDEYPDLVLGNTRYPTSVSRLHQDAIVMVNGFAHQTAIKEDTSQTCFVLGGGKTVSKSGMQRVNMLNFFHAGGVKIIPFSDLTLIPHNTESWLDIIDVFNVPIDISNYQIVMSIAGYLIFPNENTLYKTGANEFSFDNRELNIPLKIVRASKYLDLSSLGLEGLVDINNPDSDVFFQDSVMEAILDLPQSFIAVIPKQNVFIYENRITLDENTRTFHTSSEATQLLLNIAGRAISYWPIKSSGYQKNVILDIQIGYEPKIPALYTLLSSLFPQYANGKFDVRSELLSIGYYDGPIVR